MNREQRRAAAREAKKGGNNAVAEKIMLFDKMPDHCLTCEEPFDKQNKEMVMSWYVFVTNKKDEVRLYCPECMDKAKNILEDFNEHLVSRSDGEATTQEAEEFRNSDIENDGSV